MTAPSPGGMPFSHAWQATKDLGYSPLWSTAQGLHLTLRSFCNLRNPEESTPQHNNTGEVSASCAPLLALSPGVTSLLLYPTLAACTIRCSPLQRWQTTTRRTTRGW